MAIVNVDFSGLEVVTAAWLSQDKILMKEIIDGVNIHTINQVTFKLPGWEDAQNGIKSEQAAIGRLVAKTLKFRILYGGTAYSFSQDPAFTQVSKKVSFWEDVIEQYYAKYKGIDSWHKLLIKTAKETNIITSPFGREFYYEGKLRNNDFVWPITDIKNYIVQGTGADIVCMTRVMILKRFKDLKSKLISTVHDSIVADVPDNEIDIVCKIFDEEIKSTPIYLHKYYGVDFNIPLKGEVSVGPNMLDLTEVKI